MNEFHARIARAMAEAFEKASPADHVSLSDDASHISIDGRFDMEPVIRATLEAMREPTQEMLDAVDISIPTLEMIITPWHQMIDAALATEPVA